MAHTSTIDLDTTNSELPQHPAASRDDHRGVALLFAGLTRDQATGGTPYGATTLAGADGSRQPTGTSLKGLASRVDMLPTPQPG
jgi:hypothetical protein